MQPMMKNVLTLLGLLAFSTLIANCGHNSNYIPPNIEACIVGTADLKCAFAGKEYIKPFQSNMIFMHPVDYQYFRNWCTDIVKNLQLCNKDYNSLPPQHEPPVDECISGTTGLFCFDVVSGVRYDKLWATALNYIGTNPIDYRKIRTWCDNKAQELVNCQAN